ncbi:MAG TPA: hypothetical protein PLH94_03235 [Fimbriimonadaceae bacterium]|nr:hypothetical protein [Fimbriimonadaceae bacterium]
MTEPELVLLIVLPGEVDYLSKVDVARNVQDRRALESAAEAWNNALAKLDRTTFASGGEPAVAGEEPDGTFSLKINARLTNPHYEHAENILKQIIPENTWDRAKASIAAVGFVWCFKATDEAQCRVDVALLTTRAHDPGVSSTVLECRFGSLAVPQRAGQPGDAHRFVLGYTNEREAANFVQYALAKLFSAFDKLCHQSDLYLTPIPANVLAEPESGGGDIYRPNHFRHVQVAAHAAKVAAELANQDPARQGTLRVAGGAKELNKALIPLREQVRMAKVLAKTLEVNQQKVGAILRDYVNAPGGLPSPDVLIGRSRLALAQIEVDLSHSEAVVAEVDANLWSDRHEIDLRMLERNRDLNTLAAVLAGFSVGPYVGETLLRWNVAVPSELGVVVAKLSAALALGVAAGWVYRTLWNRPGKER